VTVWKPNLIRESLIQKSKELGLRLPQMQMLLAQERFLARLLTLDEGKHFIWKGGSLFLREYSTLETPRYTVDIDLLLKGIDFKKTFSILNKACDISLEDGFEFNEIISTPMERDTPYGGDRFQIKWKMFRKSQSETLKLDVCSGDVVTSIKKDFSKLSILPDSDDFNLSANIYPAEFIFAEKLETLFRFGTGNTRCKDLIDLWSLTTFNMDDATLQKAVSACFLNRSQDFSLKRLEEILHDDFFIKNMKRLAEAHFSDLEIPEISVINGDIIKYSRARLK
jgi:predicted nucleotidyltransferase component of viral defense system